MRVNGTRSEVEAIPHSEALHLLHRAALTRGVDWPADPRAVTAVGGLQGDFTSQPGPERVVWGTLNGQTSLLAVLSGERPVAWADKQLAAVTAVQPVLLPGLPHLALMVDDRNNQLVGAFFIEERRRIYVWDGRGLREVWHGTLSSEQFQHARWQNPKGPDVWRLRRITGRITLSGLMLDESLREQQLEAPGSSRAPIPPASAFHQISESEKTQRYRWEPRLRRFTAQ
jgi:hypothetical protein